MRYTAKRLKNGSLQGFVHFECTGRVIKLSCEELIELRDKVIQWKMDAQHMERHKMRQHLIQREEYFK